MSRIYSLMDKANCLGKKQYKGEVTRPQEVGVRSTSLNNQMNGGD